MRKILVNNEEGGLDSAVRKNYDPDSFMQKADYSKTAAFSDNVY